MLRNLLLTLSVLMVISGCAREDGAPARPACPQGQLCLHRGNGAEPVSLDPHRSSGTWENRIISDMIQGMFDYSAAGETIPGMAESWTTSADGLTWTFRLRDAQWSDGQSVTAEDFVYAFQRILKPEIASQYSYLLYLIQNGREVNEGTAPPESLGARALDARTLELRLINPAPYLPELMTHYTFYPVPSHKVRELGDAWVQPGNYVGNGAYTLAEWRLGDHVRLVKNPRFWDAENVCFDQVYFYPTNDATAAERRVFRGELDMNADIQSNRIQYLLADPETRPFVHTHTYLGTAYLAFNQGPQVRTPALRDRRVRQALAMAVDRDFIANRLLRGGQVPAFSFVPPGMSNYVENGPKAFYADWSLERRQREARRLLAEAGYGPDNPLRLEIKHRNTPDPSLMMPAVQADWAEIGVQVQLVRNEVQIAYQSYRLRDFDVADAAWVADFDDPKSFLDLQLSTTGQQNYGDYANPAYDALLLAADREPNEGRRAQLLAQAEQIMLDDAPIVPLYFYVNKNLVSPRMTGFVDNLVDQHRTRWMCLRNRGQ
ncbi:peptide ABC transporter substrate-binding protein [Brevundimonas sp. 2R-24]|uniref:Peptide ABC transporter substrate-binding protein n=1 Tax=Peiella sedimenti TaxID=3061083 RepID=A0ABT8SM90_9CAUL|nr:peptide ABC transporter substrate-binding protein [Caulobacteraceae bacterium XZ-24]